MSSLRFGRLTSIFSAIVATVAIVGVSLVHGGGDDPQSDPVRKSSRPAPTVPSEQSKTDPVAELQRRILALESRVAELERERGSWAAPSANAPSPRPSNWGSFEFNGQTIYIVPTDTSARLRTESTGENLVPNAGPTEFAVPATGSYDTTLLKYENVPRQAPKK
jgi:hypothetical protein